MPELPEVETIRLDLAASLAGETANTFEVFDSRLLSTRKSREWALLICGQSWRSFGRKGKYLWVELSNGYRLFFHLRMTGQLVLIPNRSQEKPRMKITFSNGKHLFLYDQRRFAEIWLLSPGEGWRRNNPLGPDALTELTEDTFSRLLKGRTTRIQPLLLDQRRLAGVGNIYAQEALFKAAIRPSRASKRLKSEEAAKLFVALRETLETAIAYRGSSSRNYLDATGQKGQAQTLHAVYRRGGLPCLKCRESLRTIRIGGRGSVYCPRCQK